MDLFSGIGGFSLAGRWAGFETVQFVEKDLFCQQVLKKHWPNVPIHGEIKTFHFTDSVDVITGGFPCQPFSVAGSKKGKEDDRYLWPDMFRIIRECKPAWVLAENVPGIIPYLDSIFKDLESEGYQWEAFLIPASSVGAPHKRERLWIVAYNNSVRCNLRGSDGEKRYIQADFQRNIEAIYTEWTQFQPQSWKTFKTQEWLTSDTNSYECDKRATDNETLTERFKRPEFTAKIRDVIGNPVNWEKDKPPLPGVDDGLSNGLDRNKALGNAIVPQIPFVFLKMIKEFENV